uniref:Uncharacterized protein n=1 Tax=Nelumbo nucifera TaxID=4432 RepID=A0A822Y272_NELNU|nr:TPA_asm: hypothetical protein HUJ06_026830 [Nelumbo nucifera]
MSSHHLLPHFKPAAHTLFSVSQSRKLQHPPIVFFLILPFSVSQGRYSPDHWSYNVFPISKFLRAIYHQSFISYSSPELHPMFTGHRPWTTLNVHHSEEVGASIYCSSSVGGTLH